MRALLREGSQVETGRDRIFDTIYRTNAWNGKGTRAGPGSSLGATALLRDALPELLADLGVTSILDAACGDSLWMTELPGYVGVDIVPDAIEVSTKRHPGRRYMVADICKDELPIVEAIICRDAMQHMSLADGLAAVSNFRRTGAAWLLASTHRDTVNENVSTGGYYQINLEAEPFCFGEPYLAILDGAWDGQNRYPHKLLGIWPL